MEEFYDYHKECLDRLKERLSAELPELSKRLDVLRLQRDLGNTTKH